MEVHHHPHVEKKNFKEYFLEFLMIFLAVTLGFFAENLREHFKNSDEINSDIQSMVADLQSDVAMFNADVSLNQLGDRRTDTLISLLKLDRSNTSHIYFLARYGILQPENNPPLLSDDFNAINKVIIAYHYLYATTEINNEVAVLSSQHAKRLIDVLKKAYHLK